MSLLTHNELAESTEPVHVVVALERRGMKIEHQSKKKFSRNLNEAHPRQSFSVAGYIFFAICISLFPPHLSPVPPPALIYFAPRDPLCVCIKL